MVFVDTSSAYIGHLFDLESKRTRFLGRGFGTVSITKQLAMNQGIPGASSIPNNAQLMMGFSSTQTDALGPLNIPGFETLPNVTNRWTSGYFVGGCAMHLAHLYEDLATCVRCHGILMNSTPHCMGTIRDDRIAWGTIRDHRITWETVRDDRATWGEWGQSPALRGIVPKKSPARYVRVYALICPSPSTTHL